MSESANPAEATAAPDAHGAQEHKHQGPSYYLIFAVLVVLTVVTVWASYWPVSPSMALIIAMAIASLKATLVALFFMHMKFEIKPIYIVVGVPLVLTIVLLLALMPDIANRAHQAHQALP